MTFDEWFSIAYPYEDIDAFEKNMARSSWEAAAKVTKENYKPIAYVSGYNNGMCCISSTDGSIVLPNGLALFKFEEN